MSYTVLHLFSGLGGGALGFKRAGFRSVGAIDCDAAACRDFTTITGEAATCADLADLTPEDLRDIAGERRPDVVFSSPPCRAFSGCLPAARAATPEYQALSDLALRGVWLALEAWSDSPPPLVVLENVPRIQSRGRRWLEHLTGLLRGYGYAVRGSTHDCGELGGLAQHRRRYLLVARHVAQVPEVLYEPPRRRVRGVGEVLGELPVPVPGGTAGGPMHRLPRLSALNWLRLALIPAGRDWRALPESVALTARASRQNGGFGVNGWREGSHTVVGAATVRSSWSSVADPRLSYASRRGTLGATGWSDAAGTVIGAARPDKGQAVCDPRLSCAPRGGVYGVVGGDAASGAVLASSRHDNGSWSVADPRVTCKRREGSLGVRGWAQASAPVISAATHHNWPAGVGDPRAADATHWLEGGDPQRLVGDPVDLDSRSPRYLVIRALDGTWHRPMTTLELAALQGLPVRRGRAWLELDGGAHASWRQRIGNAVPPPAAEAIARSMMRTLDAARGGRLLLSPNPKWVRRAAS